MNYSVGIDLVDIKQVERSVADHGERYLSRVYTPCELEQSGRRPERLAARFAAKEATMKALHRERDESLPWQTIELVNDGEGRPTLHLTGAAARLALRAGIRKLDVSVTHERGCAAAIVLAERAA